MKDGAILSDYPLEQGKTRHETTKVLELASGGQDQVPARLSKQSQRGDRCILHAAVPGDGAVVVGRRVDDVSAVGGPCTGSSGGFRRNRESVAAGLVTPRSH